MLLVQQYQGFVGPNKGFAAAVCRSIVPKVRDLGWQNVGGVWIPLVR
jgi:hypothetical protein